MIPPDPEEEWYKSVHPELREKIRSVRARSPIRANPPEWITKIPLPIRKKIWEIHNKIQYQNPIIGSGPPISPPTPEEYKFYNDVLSQIPRGGRPDLPEEVKKASPPDKDLKRIVESFNLLSRLRESTIITGHPHIAEEHVRDSLEKFADKVLTSGDLLTEAAIKTGIAKGNEEFDDALRTLSMAKESLMTAEAIKDVFAPYFSEEIRKSQANSIDALSNQLRQVESAFEAKKINYLDASMKAAKNILGKMSLNINPESLNAIATGINKLEETALQLSRMKGASKDVLDRAKETVLMAETLKKTINAYKSDFIKPPKKTFPQTSFRELASQKEKIFGFSMAVDLLRDTFSKRADMDQRTAVLNLFSDAASELARTRLDPENIETAEKLFRDASVPLRSIFRTTLSKTYGRGAVSVLQRAGNPLVLWTISQGMVPSFSKDEQGNPNPDLFQARLNALKSLTDPDLNPDGDDAVTLAIQNGLVTKPGEFIEEVSAAASKILDGPGDPKVATLREAENSALLSASSLRTAIALSKEGRFHPKGSF